MITRGVECAIEK